MTPHHSHSSTATRQRGSRLGFWFFGQALRWTGRRGAYGLVWLVAVHYRLFDRAACRAAHAYATRRFRGCSRWQQAWTVYRLFVEQGKALIDRHCLMSGAHDLEISVDGRAELDAVMNKPGKGFILLMSHMGNWQTILTAIANLEKPVHLLMRPEDNPAVRASLKLDAATRQTTTISPGQFLGGVVEMMTRLKAGEVVSIMGDRAYGAASEPVSFLGDTAHFPVAAWRLAAGAECPIVVLLPAKVSPHRYRIRVARVFQPRLEPGVNRRDQLRGWMQDYANLLEAHVRDYPYQCFLFTDIWDRITG